MTQVAVIETDAVVATMGRARMALAEAKTIQETKRVVDVAAAAEIYARRQQLGEEAEGLAHSIKIEALRKLGEMLKEAPKNTGVRLAGRNVGGAIVEPPTNVPTLADLGIDKKTSAVAQKLSELPDADYEQVREGNVTVAKAIAAIDATKPRAKKPKRELPQAPEPFDERDDLREAVKILSEENDTLRDRLAVESMPGTEDDKLQAQETIAELRARVKALEAENDALKVSRDGLMTKVAEMQRQVNYWRKRAEKVAA